MKPKRIFLVRHGESEGNVDKNVYTFKPDYALLLTPNGAKQAIDAGRAIRAIIQEETVAAYYSPYFRTRQTADIVLKCLNYKPNFVIEEPRLREQEWCGKLREDGQMTSEEMERDAYGHFYYRFIGGESCADVFDRQASMFSSVHRDFNKDNFPQNAIFFTHGMTMRLFVMRWLHLSVEEFESLSNPKNCEIWLLEKENNHKYRLAHPVRKYPHRRHQFVYPFAGPTTTSMDVSKLIAKHVTPLPKTPAL